MKLFFTGLMLSSLTLMFFADAKESTISYKKDVLPVIQQKCSICHNFGTPERNWLDYKTTFNKRKQIKLRLENRTMPIGTVMTDAERKLMIDWVDQGAKP